MTRKKRWPAQERYDRSHPILSIRLSREDYDRIQDLSKRGKIKPSVMVREALLEQVENTQEVFDAAYEEGFNEGWRQAKDNYKIRYPCSRCGELTSILPNSREHEAMMGYMKEHGWHHTECE